jgi:hypothetical protein
MTRSHGRPNNSFHLRNNTNTSESMSKFDPRRQQRVDMRRYAQATIQVARLRDAICRRPGVNATRHICALSVPVCGGYHLTSQERSYWRARMQPESVRRFQARFCDHNMKRKRIICCVAIYSATNGMIADEVHSTGATDGAFMPWWRYQPTTPRMHDIYKRYLKR